MDFKEFVNKLEQDLKDAMADISPGATVDVRSVEKLQEVFYTGITISPAGGNVGMNLNANAACQANAQAVVTKTERREKSEKPPALYDLTSFQRDANKILGFTAQQTLDYTQSLYEKKMVTYPRTDSRYLTEDMGATLPALVQILSAVYRITEEIPIHTRQVINGKKVSDHHAIIPTRELQKCKMQELHSGEMAILQLIVSRLLEAVGDPFRYAETVVEATCADTVFSSKGREIIAPGWKKITEIFRPKRSEKDPDNSVILPSLQEGQLLQVKKASVKEGQTSSPKHFTEDTLLLSMEKAGDVPDEAERQGIGTPATRAGVIEKLVQKGFVERRNDKKSKFLHATDKGTALVTVIPEQIQSASMTADWEKKLLEIEHGTCNVMIKKACREKGICEYNCHDFRHTYISMLVREGVPIPVIEKVSGDTQATIFKRYSHMFPGDEEWVLQVLSKIKDV